MIFDKNIIYNADCLDPIEGLARLPDNSIDVCITDPPYGTTACKWDTVIPFELMWEQLHRVVKDNGAIVLFGSEPFSSYLRISNIKNYRYDWLWEKDKGANWMFGNKQPLKVTEVISVFYKNQPTYNPQKIKNPNGISKRHLYKNPSKISKNVRDVMGKTWKETDITTTDNENYSGKDYEPDKLLPRQLLYFPKDQKGKFHPTQKPTNLLEYLIRTYTNEGETVLDFTMGSGTTAISAIRTGRNYIGWEKDPEYYKIAIERIQKEQAEKERSLF